MTDPASPAPSRRARGGVYAVPAAPIAQFGWHSGFVPRMELYVV